MAIVGNAKKIIQNMKMESLQELRSVQKPDIVLEDTLAAVIMICKFVIFANEQIEIYLKA